MLYYRYTIAHHLPSGDALGICLTFLVTGPLNTSRFKLLGWQELKDLNLYLTVLETEMLPLHQTPKFIIETKVGIEPTIFIPRTSVANLRHYHSVILAYKV